MPNANAFGAESPAVRAHIGVMQEVIQRMTENSRSCKLWCVTIAAAVLVFAGRIDSGDGGYALIALLPAVALGALDAYYLALERGFRASYDAFLGKLQAGELELSDLYAVIPAGSARSWFLGCLGSFSVWLFYGAVAVIAIALWALAAR